jgi:hypothetical protein
MNNETRIIFWSSSSFSVHDFASTFQKNLPLVFFVHHNKQCVYSTKISLWFMINSPSLFSYYSHKKFNKSLKFDWGLMSPLKETRESISMISLREREGEGKENLVSPSKLVSIILLLFRWREKENMMKVQLRQQNVHEQRWAIAKICFSEKMKGKSFFEIDFIATMPINQWKENSDVLNRTSQSNFLTSSWFIPLIFSTFRFSYFSFWFFALFFVLSVFFCEAELSLWVIFLH